MTFKQIWSYTLSISIVCGCQFLSAQTESDYQFRKYQSDTAQKKNATSFNNDVKSWKIISPSQRKKLLLKSAQGGGSDGGQFLIKDSFFNKITNHLDRLAQLILVAPPDQLNAIASKFNTQINWRQFAEVIKNVEYKPTYNAIGVTEKGRQVYKLMHYDLNAKKVYALEPFFEKYLTLEESQSNKFTEYLYKDALHESSHIFGIGVDNSIGNTDSLSAEFAKEIFNVIQKSMNQCGISGNLSERMLSCELAEKWNKVSNLGSWVTVFSGPTKYVELSTTYKLKDKINIYYDERSGYFITSNISTLISSREKNPQRFCDQLNSSYGNSELKWSVPTVQEMHWISLSNESGLNFLDGLFQYSGFGSDSMNNCFISINMKNQKMAVCPSSQYIILDKLDPITELAKYNSKIALSCVQRPINSDFKIPSLPQLQQMGTDWKGLINDIQHAADILD